MERSYSLVLLVVYFALCLNHVFSEITFIAERLPLKGNRELADVPWPMPEQWSRENVTFTLSPSALSLTSNLEGCDVMDDAVKRYKGIVGLYKATAPQKNVDIKEVKIHVENVTCERYPYLEMDESYAITMDPPSITVNSRSVWGALRGLETVSQLLFEENGQVHVKNWTITDRPRFPHRGFMIDTSRHYLPLPIIKKHLDAMTWSKLNVLHWHLVDAQSFPYVSAAFPQLSEKGAFTARHIYTKKAVSEVIEYARLRGIRVIPEFDTPGHAQSWGKGQPDLLTPCYDAQGVEGKAVWGNHSENENFDPTRNTTYSFLEEFMNDVAAVFPDRFLHAGMDEAHYMCWQSSPVIKKFMADNNLTTFPELEQYYVTRALDIISGTGKHVIIWQDPVDNGVEVNNTTIIEIWKNSRNKLNCDLKVPDEWAKFAEEAVKGGNKMIISSCWYLNYICYGEDWRRFYACDPLDFNATAEEKELVVGGEACMWAEFVDGTNFLQRAWPRAAAMAERVWSPSNVTDLETAAFRLDAHRCRLLRRGIPAQPVLPGYCGDYDYGFESDTPDSNGERDGTTAVPCPPTGQGTKTEASFCIPSFSLLLFAIVMLWTK